MNIYQILLTASISLVTAFLFDFYKFKRDNKHKYKGKLQNLYALLVDTERKCLKELRNYDNIIVQLSADIYKMPLYPLETYKPMNILSEKVFDDDYIIAYNSQMKNIIGAKENFQNIQQSAVHATELLKYSKQTHEIAKKEDYNRKTRFNEKIHILTLALFDYSRIPNLANKDKEFQEKIVNIWVSYINHPIIDIPVVSKELVHKIIDAFSEYGIINELRDIAELCRDLINIEREILNQHNNYLEIFKSDQQKLLQSTQVLSNCVVFMKHWTVQAAIY